MSGNLNNRVIGQKAAISAIQPFVARFNAGLNPDGRPAGVILMMGPTGTGKTHTVEALAEEIHGSRRNLLRIDCGEYQMDHEVAKLIGAPPGYLGHRETHPVLTQARLASITSENSGLTLVLFDEIEKAAPSLMRLVLGVLDKATLRLGDNNVVNFERALIFFTSNLGSEQISKDSRGGVGLPGAGRASQSSTVAAARKFFSPEWLNRIDEIVTYTAFSDVDLLAIAERLMEEQNRQIAQKLGARSFRVRLERDYIETLIQKADCKRYGARDLRRVIDRYVMRPVIDLMGSKRPPRPGETVVVGDGRCGVAKKAAA